MPLGSRIEAELWQVRRPRRRRETRPVFGGAGPPYIVVMRLNILSMLVLAAAPAAALVTMPAAAQAGRCEPRTVVRFGEDASALAHRCGINVERLKAVNPGMPDLNRPFSGTIVNVPPPALPTVRMRSGGNPALAPIIRDAGQIP